MSSIYCSFLCDRRPVGPPPPCSPHRKHPPPLSSLQRALESSHDRLGSAAKLKFLHQYQSRFLSISASAPQMFCSKHSARSRCRTAPGQSIRSGRRRFITPRLADQPVSPAASYDGHRTLDSKQCNRRAPCCTPFSANHTHSLLVTPFRRQCLVLHDMHALSRNDKGVLILALGAEMPWRLTRVYPVLGQLAVCASCLNSLITRCAIPCSSP